MAISLFQNFEFLDQNFQKLTFFEKIDKKSKFLDFFKKPEYM